MSDRSKSKPAIFNRAGAKNGSVKEIFGSLKTTFGRTKYFFKNHLIFVNLYVRINDR